MEKLSEKNAQYVKGLRSMSKYMCEDAYSDEELIRRDQNKSFGMTVANAVIATFQIFTYLQIERTMFLIVFVVAFLGSLYGVMR